MRFRSHLLFVFAFAFASTAFAIDPAQKPGSGRLTDGRAYRTDASGFKISDHIAELEVSIDDLQKQIIALEEELVAKDRLLAGKGISTNENRSQLPPARSEISDSTAEIQSLQQRISNLEQLNRTTLASCDAREQKLQQQLLNANKAQAQNTQVDQYREVESNQLRRDIQQLVSEKNQLQLSLTTVQQELTQKSAALSGQSSNIERQRSETAALRTQIAELERERDTLRAAAQTAAASRQEAAEVRLPETKETTARARLSAPAQREETRSDSDEERHLATELKPKLVQVQKLISERKDMLDTLQHRGKIVSVEVRRLVTRDGRSLDTLRAQVATPMGSEQAARVSRGLDEIVSLLNEDIVLLKRLGHL